jgi:C-terminal processing protease CtpA/Prc
VVQLLLTAPAVRSRLVLLLPALLALACSSSSSPSSSAAPATAGADGCPGESATTCDGPLIKRCERQAAGLGWSAPVACEDGQICKDEGCRALTPDEDARAAGLAALLAESRSVGATARPVDYDALGVTLRRRLLTSDGSARAYVQTLWDAMLALPQGHQYVAPPDTTSEAELEALGLSLGSLSRYKACLRPWGDHAVVTIADAGSTLRRGDEILAVDGKRGEDLKTLLVARPFGAAAFLPPSDAGRVAFALRSFLSVDREGTKLTVRRGGSEIEVTLPKAVPVSAGYGCDDAFGRDYTKPALGTVLADGTGVLYIPAFNQTTTAAFEAEVGPEFDKVKSAPRLVIDLRGNAGGRLQSALDLVSQLPGAVKKSYCEFFERTPDSAPPTYLSRGVRAVDPSVVPQPPRFRYAGRVAVLIDGATHSAGEHFVLATKTATSALVVGTKTAGAYGTITGDTPRTLPGSPKMELSINRSQARRSDGAVLDGTSMEPDVEIGYDPASLAKGEDPMLVRAVAELTK